MAKPHQNERMWLHLKICCRLRHRNMAYLPIVNGFNDHNSSVHLSPYPPEQSIEFIQLKLIIFDNFPRRIFYGSDWWEVIIDWDVLCWTGGKPLSYLTSNNAVKQRIYVPLSGDEYAFLFKHDHSYWRILCMIVLRIEKFSKLISDSLFVSYLL